MYQIQFTEPAKKRFKKLPKDIRVRIVSKLEFFLSHEDPLIYSEVLTNPKIGTYRFRVGDYRVIFDLEKETLLIHDVDLRGRIYRK
jgi:mRNA interferase RelE/StbE